MAHQLETPLNVNGHINSLSITACSTICIRQKKDCLPSNFLLAHWPLYSLSRREGGGGGGGGVVIFA